MDSRMNRPGPVQSTAEPDALVERLRSIIGTVALDCDCRQRVNDALGRFTEMERQREIRRRLLSSRHHRAAILALAELLAELDDISWAETDRGVFVAFAHLFEDISEHALRSAADLRQIGGPRS
jgi:hypothetical protein